MTTSSETPAMSHIDIKAAREALGLSIAEMARMLETDKKTQQRMEMDPAASTARTPAPRMVRLIRLYLAGARPNDWPDAPAPSAIRSGPRAS